MSNSQPKRALALAGLATMVVAVGVIVVVLARPSEKTGVVAHAPAENPIPPVVETALGLPERGVPRELRVEPAVRVETVVSDAATTVEATQPEAATGPLTIEVVHRASGRPVPEARVIVRSLDAPGGVEIGVVEGTSDPTGVVVLSASYGSLEITAHSPRRALGWTAVVHDGSKERERVRVELDELATVSGIVRDVGGEPQEGVRVTAGTVPSARLWDVRTDASGFFEFPAWIVGPAASLSFEQPGFGWEHLTLLVDEQRRWCVLGDDEEMLWNEGDVFVEVVLTPSKTVTGRLVGLGGKALPGAVVRARGLAFSSFFMGHKDESSTVTDDEGAFVLTGLRFDVAHTLMCEAAGVAIAVASAPEEVARVDLGVLRLVDLVRLTGRVVDRQGRPVMGAMARTTLTDIASLNVMPGSPWDTSLPLPMVASEADTDADGEFDLLVPPRSQLSLTVSLGATRLLERTFELGDTDIDLGRLRLEREIRTVTGLLVDPHGVPYAQGRLEVMLRNDLLWTRCRTDDRGRFEFVAPSEHSPDVVLMLRSADGLVTSRWRPKSLDVPLRLQLNEVPPIGAAGDDGR